MEEKRMGVVYMYTLRATGERYIGKTIHLWLRIRQHEEAKDKNSIFHDAIKEHGYDAFNFEILEWNYEHLLIERERWWIKKHNTFWGPGFNLTEGGGGPSPGWNHTEESIEKMRLSRLGEKNPFYGRKHSEETKDRMRGPRPSMQGENHPSKRENSYEYIDSIVKGIKRSALERQIEQEKENGQGYFFYPYKD